MKIINFSLPRINYPRVFSNKKIICLNYLLEAYTWSNTSTNELIEVSKHVMQKLHIHRKEETNHAEAAFCLDCSSTLITIRFPKNANVHCVSH